MVERFHRQLKAAIKAQPKPDAWMNTLPLILLGIRKALKEDLKFTTAEMVYGTTLRLPGEFFTPSTTDSLPDPSNFIHQLKTHFQTVRPTAPRIHQGPSHISDGLSTATHVFIRCDGVRKPLQPPNDGPYPIVKRTDKHFTIALNGRNDTVSIKRLKPAHLDTDNSNSNPQMKELLPNEISNHTTTTHPTPPISVTTLTLTTS